MAREDKWKNPAITGIGAPHQPDDQSSASIESASVSSPEITAQQVKKFLDQWSRDYKNDNTDGTLNMRLIYRHAKKDGEFATLFITDNRGEGDTKVNVTLEDNKMAFKCRSAGPDEAALDFMIQTLAKFLKKNNMPMSIAITASSPASKKIMEDAAKNYGLNITAANEKKDDKGNDASLRVPTPQQQNASIVPSAPRRP